MNLHALDSHTVCGGSKFYSRHYLIIEIHFLDLSADKVRKIDKDYNQVVPDLQRS